MNTVKTFSGQDLFIGIDVHKQSWHISVMSEFVEFKPLSIAPDPGSLVDYLHSHFPEGNYLAAYEAGFCGFQPCKVLRALGVDCIIVHPADIPTTDKEKKRKSDPVDSKKIARGLRSRQLEGIHVPEDADLWDRALLRRREQLVKDQTRCKNRIKNYLSSNSILTPDGLGHWSRAYLAWLEKVGHWHPVIRSLWLQLCRDREELRQVTRQLVAMGKTERYNRDILLLRSIPGIGILTATTLAIEIGDMKRFRKFDQLAAFIGLIPNIHQSGDTERSGQITSRGKKLLKRCLIEASWIAIKSDPELMARFTALAYRMNKNRAIIRIAKNLLSRIKAVLDRGQPYQINYNLSRPS